MPPGKPPKVPPTAFLEKFENGLHFKIVSFTFKLAKILHVLMKARLKTILLTALGAMATFSAITYTSCTPDKCKAINCAYGGVCDEGNCTCASGYEGTHCETITRDKYTDVWTVFEKGSTSTATQYSVSIDNGTNITDITIKNFQNRFTDLVSGYVKGDTLYIPQQTVNGNTVQGIGYLADDKYYSQNGRMIVKYKVTDMNGITNDFGLDGVADPSVWNK